MDVRSPVLGSWGWRPSFCRRPETNKEDWTVIPRRTRDDGWEVTAIELPCQTFFLRDVVKHNSRISQRPVNDRVLAARPGPRLHATGYRNRRDHMKRKLWRVATIAIASGCIVSAAAQNSRPQVGNTSGNIITVTGCLENGNAGGVGIVGRDDRRGFVRHRQRFGGRSRLHTDERDDCEYGRVKQGLFVGHHCGHD
jgi:hypothetical protein